MASIEDLIGGARDSVTVKRVYGEPYEKDGVVLIPAASVRGGGGAGEGDGGGSQGTGSGGGFGMTARPVGAFQVSNGEVSWIPATDTTRVIVMGQLVGLVALLVLRSIIRGRRRKA